MRPILCASSEKLQLFEWAIVSLSPPFLAQEPSMPDAETAINVMIRMTTATASTETVISPPFENLRRLNLASVFSVIIISELFPDSMTGRKVQQELQAIESHSKAASCTTYLPNARVVGFCKVAPVTVFNNRLWKDNGNTY